LLRSFTDYWFAYHKQGPFLNSKNRFNLNGIDISGVIFNAIQKRASGYYYDDIFAYSSALEGYYKKPIESQFSE
tara:strand:- start:36 stop:257 length:222 start_codon:yes stop_codon:yes gene_type:complete